MGRRPLVKGSRNLRGRRGLRGRLTAERSGTNEIEISWFENRRGLAKEKAESGAEENRDYFLKSARWGWSCTAEVGRVSGTFLFIVSFLRSMPLIMGRR